MVGHLAELASWPGDIWAINWTADFLLSKGVDCTLFTIDPIVKASTAAKRVIASSCDPELFNSMTQTFDVCEVEPAGITGGPTSATRAPSLALRLGYPSVVFFGCDSSFEESDHVDRHEAQDQILIVRANGRDFKTYPDLLMQAECLSDVLGQFPQYFSSVSDGLVDAMVKDPNWEVVAVSEGMKSHLIEVNGDSGLYESSYSTQGQ